MSNHKHAKSASVVGEVMKKYHPHGDSAIYDAMVRLGQWWNLRYPLVDPQGNFGSMDGDMAAAMRYTEARMTKVAEEILSDLEKETVDMKPNYDETTEEPAVLPSALPNLLINGASGIAVGMATNIPPHNLTEICNGLLALIDNPAISLDEMMTHVKGPDFPTGGRISAQGIREAFEPATRRLSLTGTPFRSDTAYIPFVRYELGADGIERSKADYTYGYGPALRDHVVRPVIFMAYSGQMRWRTSAGEEMAAQLGEGFTKDITSHA